MKKLFNLTKAMFTLLAGVAVAVSCQDSTFDAGISLEDELSSITFQGAVGTRATDTQFEDGDEISVSAYESDGSVFASNVKYSYSGDLFSSTSAIRYEDDEQTLSFKALYPYVEFSDSGDFSFEIQGDQSGDNGYTLSDLMSSSASSTTSVTPSLTFSHLLTKVIINFTTVDVEMTDAVTSLSVLTGVDYNISTQGYTATGESSTVTMASNGVNSFKAIIVPQNIEQGGVFGSIVAGGESYEIVFENGKIFKAGSEYEFDLSIREGSLKFESSYINDWDDGDDSSEGSSEFSLSEVSSTAYPSSSKKWIVTDSIATYEDFAGLRDALYAYRWSNSDKIMLEFPNLTSLPASALSSSYGFESISLPVATSIGEKALYSCTYLTLVDAPLVDSIGTYAFYYCTGLTSLDLPSATWVDTYAFDRCTSLSTISLASAEEVGNYAFYRCTTLSDVSLPAAKTLGTYLFNGCTALTSVSLPAVTTVGNYVFKDCAVLTSLSLATESELVEFGDGEMNCFDGVDISAIDLTVGSNVGVVDRTVIVPIADNGFVNYGSFKSVTGGTAYDDVAPTSIQDYSATNYPLISNDWVIEDSEAPLAYFIGLNEALIAAGNSGRTINLSFPNLDRFPSTAFYIDEVSISSISSVSAPNATSVGSSTFRNSSLTSISMPKMTELGTYAFYSCSALTTVSLPEATELGSYAFYFCSELTTVSLPEATMIGSSAFCRCSALASIDIPKVSTIAGGGVYYLGAFYNCSALTAVSLPVATEIGSYAFYSCSKLTTVSLPEVTTIGSSAFCGCSALATVSLPKATEIGSSAFGSCSALTSVLLPKATEIGSSAFGSCSALTSVLLPEAMTIESSAFGACSALTTVSLPKATMIGSSAFGSCSALTSVLLPEAMTIGSSAFRSCSALTSIDLPKVTTIESTYSISNYSYGAFYECTALVSASMPKATSVGIYTFACCRRLQSLNLASLSSFGSSSLLYDSYMLIDLEIATASNVTLTSFGIGSDIDISYMTLTIGEANKDLVNDNYLTLNGTTFGPFKTINLSNSSY